MSDKLIYFKNVLDTQYTLQIRQWRNQKFVRENMLGNTIISEEQHRKYIDFLRNNTSQKVYIAFYKDAPTAVMTMKHCEGYIETGSYLIHEEDMGKGFGIITGYARMEYVFSCMPDGEMRTVILEHNQKNLSLQKNFGCELRSVDTVEKTDGTTESLYLYTMDRPTWEKRKTRIQRAINVLVPIQRIQWIE